MTVEFTRKSVSTGVTTEPPPSAGSALTTTALFAASFCNRFTSSGLDMDTAGGGVARLLLLVPGYGGGGTLKTDGAGPEEAAADVGSRLVLCIAWFMLVKGNGWARELLGSSAEESEASEAALGWGTRGTTESGGHTTLGDRKRVLSTGGGGGGPLVDGAPAATAGTWSGSGWAGTGGAADDAPDGPAASAKTRRGYLRYSKR